MDKNKIKRCLKSSLFFFPNSEFFPFFFTTDSSKSSTKIENNFKKEKNLSLQKKNTINSKRKYYYFFPGHPVLLLHFIFYCLATGKNRNKKMKKSWYLKVSSPNLTLSVLITASSQLPSNFFINTLVLKSKPFAQFFFSSSSPSVYSKMFKFQVEEEENMLWPRGENEETARCLPTFFSSGHVTCDEKGVDGVYVYTHESSVYKWKRKKDKKREIHCLTRHVNGIDVWGREKKKK